MCASAGAELSADLDLGGGRIPVFAGKTNTLGPWRSSTIVVVIIIIIVGIIIIIIIVTLSVIIVILYNSSNTNNENCNNSNNDYSAGRRLVAYAGHHGPRM